MSVATLLNENKIIKGSMTHQMRKTTMSGRRLNFSGNSVATKTKSVVIIRTSDPKLRKKGCGGGNKEMQ